MTLYPTILCGGSGSRLWPVSRGGYPKQYLNLLGEHSLLQQTVQRLQGLHEIAAPILVANQEQRFLVAEQMRELGVQPLSVVLEPMGRNTAPAVAVAAMLAQRDPDALLLVLPADHLIRDEEQFRHRVEQATKLAEAGYLVTFGILPTGPHTGYGYIHRGAAIDGQPGAYAVDAFVEKPNAQVAANFLTEGGYYWNSGMFLFKAQDYLDELRRLNPEMLRQAEQALQASTRDLEFTRLDAGAFALCPSDSIDYAVMEKTDRAAVVEAANLGWDDIGSWSALYEQSEHDADGNALQGDVIAHNSRDNYVRASHRLVATVGVKDLVVIETADAVLVAARDQVQDVKKIVEQLQASGRNEAVTHRRVLRPWGAYEGIDAGDRFQVKRITVKPGGSLSLQMHYHRAEHWVVVRGTALVTNGEHEILLGENQSTYIPAGVKHRLTNPGKVELELIEVQSGSYLGEDDIVRFEDVYGRAAQNGQG